MIFKIILIWVGAYIVIKAIPIIFLISSAIWSGIKEFIPNKTDGWFSPVRAKKWVCELEEAFYLEISANEIKHNNYAKKLWKYIVKKKKKVKKVTKKCEKLGGK